MLFTISLWYSLESDLNVALDEGIYSISNYSKHLTYGVSDLTINSIGKKQFKIVISVVQDVLYISAARNMAIDFIFIYLYITE